jgi:hypothetical protein
MKKRINTEFAKSAEDTEKKRIGKREMATSRPGRDKCRRRYKDQDATRMKMGCQQGRIVLRPHGEKAPASEGRRYKRRAG